MTVTTLTMTDAQHRGLHDHLFPADGLEAVALVLCGQRRGERHRLSVREIAYVPHHSCDRAVDHVTWRTDFLPALLEKAEKKGLAILKIHGHRSLREFSEVDNASDDRLFPSLYGWLGDDHVIGSMIMMEDGELLGRFWSPERSYQVIDRLMVAGDDIRIWDAEDRDAVIPDFGKRVAQSFGKGTFALLRTLKIGVVGVSGTGSPVIEMLARNCVGKLVLVDPDVIEQGNLNRILNATMADAEAATPKVEVTRRAIAAMGLGTAVETHCRTLFDREVVEALADCDVVFGCMDSVDGRHLLNRLAAFYAIPYFDLGVRLDADGEGGVDQVCGSVHYIKPGGSSLLSRRVYTGEQLRAAGLQRTDPAAYCDLLAEGYIKGVAEDRPAVIQLNMLIASLAVNELLARLHPYRLDPNGEFAVRRISLSHGIFESADDGQPCAAISKHVGRGDVEPLLEWPELSRRAA